MGLSRLFVAVGLPDETRHDLAALLSHVEIPGKRVAPGDWHLTLQFIGAANDSTMDRLVHELDRASRGEAFRMRWEGFGAFPRDAKATVMWLGVGDGASELERLADVVAGAVAGAGIEPDERPFRPHLTLSRIRPPCDIAELIATAEPIGVGMRCGAVSLMASHLQRPRGARYQEIERFPLG